MKKLLFYFCVLCVCLSASAQDTPDAFADRINFIFQYVDKSQVSTGILQEYGIEFTSLNNYNGQALNDNNSFGSLKDILFLSF